MIKVTKISKSYQKKLVFKHVSFSVAKGEMVAIVGESGVGKTTLLNCIGQLEQIDDGEICIGGQVMQRRNRRHFFKETAGFLFQNFALMDNETVKNNLKIVSKNVVLMRETLDLFGISDLLEAKVYQLSGGEQQRVALARLLLKKPEIIFADEPTASLDEKNGKLVFDVLRQQKQAGKTIIAVTHDMRLANQFDRLIDFSTLK